MTKWLTKELNIDGWTRNPTNLIFLLLIILVGHLNLHFRVFWAGTWWRVVYRRCPVLTTFPVSPSTGWPHISVPLYSFIHCSCGMDFPMFLNQSRWVYFLYTLFLWNGLSHVLKPVKVSLFPVHPVPVEWTLPCTYLSRWFYQSKSYFNFQYSQISQNESSSNAQHSQNCQNSILILNVPK